MTANGKVRASTCYRAWLIVFKVCDVTGKFEAAVHLTSIRQFTT
jgi:hypothetical protein